MSYPLDKAMSIMWEEMGWKGSAKTQDVVIAIRDFYTKQLSPVTKEDINEPESEFTQPQEDEWAIGCINNHELRPLHEALDSDCSNFVTIHKLNEFTSARPSGWSLPLWLAYWTTGFEVTLRQYTSRIRIELYRISSIYPSLVLGNTGVYTRLLHSHIMQLHIDRVVAGIYMHPSEGHQEYLHDKFQEYAATVEEHVEKELESCDYFIDGWNTLSIVVASGFGGRLEEYALPLIYLILRQIRSILTHWGRTIILSDAEFHKPLKSLETLWSVICNRGEVLKGAYKLRKLESNEELRRYCYGMYYFVAIESSKDEFEASETSYYNMPDGFYDAPISDLDGEETTLKIDNSEDKDGNDELVFDMDSSLKVSAELETSIINEQSTTGLNDVWHGYFFRNFYSNDRYGIVEFRIDYINEDNTFIGTGTDSFSAFTIEGKWNGRRISFWTKYDSQFICDHPSKMTGWFYTGKFNDSLDAIAGNWGDPLLASTENVQANSSSNDEDEENSEIEMDGFRGRFVIGKKSVDYTRFRPSDEEFKENKPRAYWKFALNAVIDSVSKRVFTWSNLEKRRDTRYMFISVFITNQNQNFENESSRDELYTLRKQLSAVEFRFYHHLAQVFRSRTVQHRILCDCCQKPNISATRYMCLTCSARHYFVTVDICGDCIDKQFTTFRDNDEQLNHVSSHTLLQIRRPFALRDQYRARRAAESILDAHNPIQTSSGILCSVCEKFIEERPYWICCVCEGLFVCHACNWEIERSQPWLYEVEKNEDENAHHWSHDLVLIANPELLGVSLSVEEPTDTPVQQISRILQDLQLKEGSRPVNQHIWSNGDTTNQTIPPNRDSPSSNSTSVSQALQTAHSNVHQTSYNITIIQNSMLGASTSSNTEAYHSALRSAQSIGSNARRGFKP